MNPKSCAIRRKAQNRGVSRKYTFLLYLKACRYVQRKALRADECRLFFIAGNKTAAVNITIDISTNMGVLLLTDAASTKEMHAQANFPAIHFATDRLCRQNNAAVCMWMHSPLNPSKNAAMGNDGSLPSEKRPPVISRSPFKRAKIGPSASENRRKLTVRQTKKFAQIAAIERTDEKMHFENTVCTGGGEKPERADLNGSFFPHSYLTGRVKTPVMSDAKR